MHVAFACELLLLNMSVLQGLGLRNSEPLAAEVWTVYIEDKSDMMKIADAAHLIFGSHHPMRRAKKVTWILGQFAALFPTAARANDL